MPSYNFFTESEYLCVSELMDKIIPSDSRSGGARTAGVPEFVDAFLAASPDAVRREWRDGLAALNKMSLRMFGIELSAINGSEQTRLLFALSRREQAPETAAEKFFVTLKTITCAAYYSSPIGIHKELGYSGTVRLPTFVGCTHVEHC